MPGRRNEFYFGAVNDGVWKSIDAGRVWMPVFDGQPVASIGAITVAASAPDAVYVGSGESTLCDSGGFGNGMYKSADAGKTLTTSVRSRSLSIRRIQRLCMPVCGTHVGTLAHLRTDERPGGGIFKSTDGGETWKRLTNGLPKDGIGRTSRSPLPALHYTDQQHRPWTHEWPIV